MLKIIKHKKIKNILILLKDLDFVIENSPYERREYYIVSLKKISMIYHILLNRIIFYEFKVPNKRVVIPLYDSLLNNELRLYGDSFGFGFCNLISNKNIDEDFISNCISKLISINNDKKIIFNRVLVNSKLYNVLSSMKLPYNISPAVRIPFKNDYDSHFKSLKKSSRQNVRTAYNRLNKSEKNYSFEIHDLNSIDDNLIYDVVKLYLNRLKKYKKLNLFDKLYFKYFDLCFKYLKTSSRCSLVTLKIDSKLASFMVILKEGESLFCPRLAISDDYSFYSPGIVLVDCYIKHLYQNNSSIKVLDMMQGKENYKLVLGGEEYNVYDFYLN